MSISNREFAALVAPHRRELHAYCYRMLGALQDAEDALQDTLLAAWKGLPAFEGRSSLRSWLYRIATNACLRLAQQRPKRILPYDRAPASGGSVVEPALQEVPWLEPYPVSEDASVEQRESLELAFVAALQHLAPLQRAVLILCEVLEFSAVEAADLLETSVPAINSALQRAKSAVSARVPPMSQQTTLAQLGDRAREELVRAYVDAWAQQDARALVALLTHDARFTMPPIPSWFDGRDAVVRFFAEPVFRTPWRLVPTWASGQLAFAAYQGPDFRLGALNVVQLRGGQISEIVGFLDPKTHQHFSLPGRRVFAANPLLLGMKKTYRGSCHCGAVQFECQLDLSAGTTRCNCSFCRKARFWMAFAKAADFRLIKGEDSLRDYQHTPAGKTSPFLHLSFCGHCGVRAFSRGGPLPQFDGPFVAVNVACLDDATDAELAGAPVHYADGRNDAWQNVAEESRYL